ncbi:MAG TPA: YtxH domain-containing protein [Candidatus Limnocylindria bacterium]|nr:YtxH domain-containing protein [Candidatus Limnocylindria bacterium]
MAKLDLRELRDLTKDVKVDEILGDVRDALASSADTLIGDGRKRARQAVGGHDDGALFAAFGVGMLVGALVGAAVALLMTPMSGADARRKLGQQVEKARGQEQLAPAWETSGAGNGRAYQPTPTAHVPER